MPLVGLRPNELVRTPDGLGTVVSVDAVEGEQPVWNLEVHGTHTYHAGSGGVLVHNMALCEKILKAQQIAMKAAQGFENLQCVECTNAIVKALKKEGLSGEVIDLISNGSGIPGGIYSDRFGGFISTNGKHRAVPIGGLVFDNHNPSGTPYQNWIDDLHTHPSFQPLIVTPF